MSKSRASNATKHLQGERMAWAVLRHAVLTGRLDATGQTILTASPVASAMYAHKVLKRRWKWAEPVIATHGLAAYKYADLVIKGRFPLGEKSIATHGGLAYIYAKKIFKDRFPLGEKSIAKDPFASARYASSIVKGRWRKGEKAIMKEPEAMLIYARGAIKGRLPDPLHAAMTMLSFSDPSNEYIKKYFARYGTTAPKTSKKGKG
jgi:hypothetical protein